MKILSPARLKLLLIFIPVYFSTGHTLMAQEGFTARFAEAEDFLLQEHGNFKTVFSIKIADFPDIEPVISQAALMPETFTLAVDQPSSEFHCFTLYFTHPTDAAYVKKILLFIGIRQIIVNGKVQNLEDFDPED